MSQTAVVRSRCLRSGRPRRQDHRALDKALTGQREERRTSRWLDGRNSDAPEGLVHSRRGPGTVITSPLLRRPEQGSTLGFRQLPPGARRVSKEGSGLLEGQPVTTFREATCRFAPLDETPRLVVDVKGWIESTPRRPLHMERVREGNSCIGDLHCPDVRKALKEGEHCSTDGERSDNASEQAADRATDRQEVSHRPDERAHAKYRKEKCLIEPRQSIGSNEDRDGTSTRVGGRYRPARMWTIHCRHSRRSPWQNTPRSTREC
jgi:hypothetical protein